MEVAMTYLVTGATGEVATRVVEFLLERGERPRVFVRDVRKARRRFGDRVDAAIGDLADAGSLFAALQGMDALFLVNGGPEIPRRDELAAKAAKAAGVRHLVKLSSMDAQQDVGTGVWHARGEAAIRASGITFTFVRPTGFMVNALFWAAPIKAAGVVRSATGGGKIPFIHTDDIAGVATEALTTRKYDGRSLPITGPEALSYAEMAAKIGAVIGKPVGFEAIGEEVVRQRMSESGDSEEMIAAHLSIYRAIREGRLAEVTGTVERVLGRKPITFDRWAQQNAPAFR
jgi:(4-alkanoyl-5-oxo-2,5-dihydrofuran-3-yl)methyl phosphate reductase